MTTAPDTTATDPLATLPTGVRKWIVAKFYRSWAWLAALLVGVVPVVLPDIINWGIAHADIAWALLPTLSEESKMLLLKIAAVAVVVLRPIAQPKSMPGTLTPVVSVQIPTQYTATLADGQQAVLDAVGQATSDGSAVLNDAANAAELVKAEFLRHARMQSEPKP